jgi:predicted molibdopterin-dependent oxidoreductase YjgC
MTATLASGILHRVAGFDTPRVSFSLDGRPMQARQGESVLAAILCQGGQLRPHEIDGAPRAGFCLMGACQDCWVWIGPGERGRACTTPVADGMRVSTSPDPPA